MYNLSSCLDFYVDNISINIILYYISIINIIIIIIIINIIIIIMKMCYQILHH
jgi:hypothetical protein